MGIAIRHINSFDERSTTLIRNLTGSIDRLSAKIEAATPTLDELSISSTHLALSNNALKEAIVSLTTAVTQLSAPNVIIIVSGQSIHIPGLQQGEDMSYTVARDHQDEPFSLDPITASDSEGAIEVQFTERLESSNPDVVSIVGEAPSQSFHFGTFGGATVNRIVTFDGRDFIVSSAVFNVTPGQITFAGGGIQVPGLTPDAPTE